MYTNRLDNIFDSFFNDAFFATPWNSRVQRRPEVNVYQSEKGYDLELKAPGLSRGDVDISVEDNKLSIASTYAEDEGFKRVFELPEDADQSMIGAEIRDGIIYISVPKIPAAAPRRIEVKSA